MPPSARAVPAELRLQAVAAASHCKQPQTRFLIAFYERGRSLLLAVKELKIFHAQLINSRSSAVGLNAEMNACVIRQAQAPEG